MFGEWFELCDDRSQLPVNNGCDSKIWRRILKGRYKPPEVLSSRPLFVVLVIDRVCEYPTKRLNPFLDFSDLIPICGGLLRETVKTQQEEVPREDLRRSSL